MKISKKLSRVLVTVALVAGFCLVFGPQIHAQPRRSGKQAPPKKALSLDERINKLSGALELSETQSVEMRSIISGSLELAAIERKKLHSDYHALALANQERINRDGARIKALLSLEQWERYEVFKSTAKLPPAERQLERLIHRLDLSADQKPLFLEINAISRRQRQNLKGAVRPMMQMRAIRDNTDKAVEKMLTDAQRVEYKKYKKERDEQMGERRGNRDRDGRGGGRGGRGGKSGGRGSGGGRGGW